MIFFDNFFINRDFREKRFCMYVCHKMVIFLQKMSKNTPPKSRKLSFATEKYFFQNVTKWQN